MSETLAAVTAAFQRPEFIITSLHPSQERRRSLAERGHFTMMPDKLQAAAVWWNYVHHLEIIWHQLATCRVESDTADKYWRLRWTANYWSSDCIIILMALQGCDSSLTKNRKSDLVRPNIRRQTTFRTDRITIQTQEWGGRVMGWWGGSVASAGSEQQHCSR